MLKIISGTKKNTSLMQPTNITRPTLQRIRKNIFDTISTNIRNKIIIDCFAGSGAMGLEALSLGAKHVYFIEKDIKTFEILQNNVKKLQFEKNATLINEDFFNINSYKNLIEKADIIFIDPPYDNFAPEEILLTLYNLQIQGLCVFETNKEITNQEYKIRSMKKISDKYITFINNFE